MCGFYSVNISQNFVWNLELKNFYLTGLNSRVFFVLCELFSVLCVDTQGLDSRLHVEKRKPSACLLHPGQCFPREKKELTQKGKLATWLSRPRPGHLHEGREGAGASCPTRSTTCPGWPTRAGTGTQVHLEGHLKHPAEN